MLKLITNAHVFAPEDHGVCHLLIAGERIVWLGEDLDDLGVLKPVETFDLQGQRLIPGL
ncbi:MAG: beta-aspartyl-peptidase, partial [Wenzhouxiangella sp.]